MPEPGRPYSIHYVEFPSSDLRRTKAFYERALGWAFTDYGSEYTSFETDAPVSGGFLRTAEPRTGGPLVVVHADDLDPVLRAVRSAGATIVQDVFEFPGGRRFEFEDPDGNRLAVSSST